MFILNAASRYFFEKSVFIVWCSKACSDKGCIFRVSAKHKLYSLPTVHCGEGAEKTTSRRISSLEFNTTAIKPLRITHV